MLTEKTITFLPYLQLNGRPVRPLRNADGERARAQALRALVERFDIEPFPDFSAK